MQKYAVIIIRLLRFTRSSLDSDLKHPVLMPLYGYNVARIGRFRHTGFSRSHIIPLATITSPTERRRYRPISRLSSIGKLVEKTWALLIYDHLEIDRFQFGFRPGLDCEQAIASLCGMQHQLLDRVICSLDKTINAMLNVWFPLPSI